MKVHENAERVADVTMKVTQGISEQSGISDEYLREYSTRRILETMCDYYRDEPYTAFGREIAP